MGIKFDMKFITILMTVGIIIFTISGFFINQPTDEPAETPDEKVSDGEKLEEEKPEFQFFGLISAEIYLLAVGLIITAVTTGIGLFYSSQENRAARDERNLSLVGNFSSQLTGLKDKERNLKSKKDCETYAQNYVDLMDQIAFLHLSESIPAKVTAYFENELSYALTMINWMNDHNIENKLTECEFEEERKDGKKEKIIKLVVEKDSVDKAFREAKEKDGSKAKQYTVDDVLAKDFKFKIHIQYPWTDLIEWCKKKEILPFPQLQLPKTMRVYEELAEEETEKILEIVNQFSQQITELKGRERSLKTKKDCEVYAQNFIDLMDQIAFLYLKNTFPSDLSKYFENEFAYALTMIEWYENNNIDKEKADFRTDKVDWGRFVESIDVTNGHADEYTWSSLLKLCNPPKPQEKESNKKEILRTIVPLKDDALPTAMLEYKTLPEEELEPTMGIIKEYGEKLTTLIENEKEFEDGDYLKCELYANSYLDTLDGIAFLYRQKVIPEKIAGYFENYFCYALTLFNWLRKQNLVGPILVCKNADCKKGEGKEISFQDWVDGKEGENKYVAKEFLWTDLMNWCKKNEIEPFSDDNLPPVMQKMDVPNEYQLKK